MRRRRFVTSLCISLVAVTGVASAHRVGNSRFDAPIPLEFVFAGAAITVAATAVWLSVTAETPVTGRMGRSRPIPHALRAPLRYGSRAVFFVGFLVAVGHGLFGPQAEADNFATVFFWGVWLKGVGLLAILVGSPWRVLSPWRALYDGLVRLEGDEIAVVGEYPPWLGSWPAVVGFVGGVGIVANLTVIPRSPAATAVVVAGYAAVMVLSGVIFGESWFRHADALSVFYRLLGRVAPIRFGETGDGYRATVRPPWADCTRHVQDLSLVVFIIATVYTVSFDGFTSTPEYQTILFGLRDALGSGPETSVLIYAIGLCVFVAAFVGVSWGMALVAGERGQWQDTARVFAPTVLPIAAAYEVAHNYPFVIENVGRLLAIGWSITISPAEPVALLDWLVLEVLWRSQVVFIVGGHLIAIVAAHDIALQRYSTLENARRGHLPLVALMIGYTVLSLWIISRPVVAG